MVELNEWPLVEADNQAELLAHLGTAPCATSQRSAELTWVLTGVPSAEANGVMWARLSAEQADVHVPLLVQQFRDQGLPAVWHLDGATEPRDIRLRLEALGCTPISPAPAMGARLSRLSREMSRFPGLTIERATTSEELHEWMGVRRQVEPEAGSMREELYLSLGLSGRQSLQHYVARVDGKPAGVAQLFLGQRAAGLYSVGVPAAFRGRGIGTALVLTPLLVARTLGYDTGVVRPPADSVMMYEHLGFERLASSVAGYSIGV